MIATAADYRWFEERPEGLAEAYCLTLVRGLTAAEFLARLSAWPERPRVGVAALFEPSMMLWNEYPDGGLLIGVTTVSSAGIDWTIGVEVNGFLGVTEDLIVPLSAGTRLVSHSRNIRGILLVVTSGSPAAWRINASVSSWPGSFALLILDRRSVTKGVIVLRTSAPGGKNR